MINQATQYVSDKATDLTQFASDKVTEGTEFISDKFSEVSIEASEKFDEATQKASDVTAHVVSEAMSISPFAQMMKSATEPKTPVVDQEGRELPGVEEEKQLTEQGRELPNIKEPDAEGEEMNFPRYRRHRPKSNHNKRR